MTAALQLSILVRRSTQDDAKTPRKIIRLRKVDKGKREEEAALLELQIAALGGV